MENKYFGTLPNGENVHLLTLTNGALRATVITYGGAVQSLWVPDRNGRPVDVLLGFDTLEDYCRQDKYIGALIGRYANRIGKAKFTMHGQEYRLAANDGENHLHGGMVGYDKRVWKVETQTENQVTLFLDSPDGEEGYPGNLQVRVIYTLTENALEIEYTAQSDADTPCNLTNHAYFNLSGHNSGPVYDQTYRFWQINTPRCFPAPSRPVI